jgi:hypothetical protein
MIGGIYISNVKIVPLVLISIFFVTKHSSLVFLINGYPKQLYGFCSTFRQNCF